MKWLFRAIRPDEVEQELTQQDQFNTDKVPLAATLVRESLQNSTDARAAGYAGPVRVRIAAATPGAKFRDLWTIMLAPLRQHLAACDVAFDGVDLESPSFLVVEDFGTTGLTGSYETRDADNFNDFWRRVGRSHKAPGKGGSWGLGKLVFPVASAIRTFFGLTIRPGESGRPLLMGQAVLSTHNVKGIDYAPHAFFATASEDQFQLPVTDRDLIEAFAKAAGFARQAEPGLSIAIPFPQDGLAPKKLAAFAVENYFFPILTRQLEVEIAGETISAATFDTVTANITSGALQGGHLARFIRALDRARNQAPDFTLPPRWSEGKEFGASIPDAELEKLRNAYHAGELVHVRAPIVLRRRAGQGAPPSDFDLFLRRADDAVPATALTPLFIRGSLTVPNESTNFRNRRAFAALVASGGAVAEFLRDAENPAHTSWNGNAAKLAKNWFNPARRLSEIRHSLRQLHDLLDSGVRREDEDALRDLISLRKGGTAPDPRPGETVDRVKFPDPSPSTKLYTIEKRKGGFVVKNGPGFAKGLLPLTITVQVAYDLPMGDPFKRFSPYDFDLRLYGDVNIEKSGATCTVPEANRLVIEPKEDSFQIAVKGFDVNRDVVVGASSS